MNKSSPVTCYKDLGRIPYDQAFDYQRKVQSEIISEKRAGHLPQNSLLLCEHDPVYTLGKSGSANHLLYDTVALEAKGISYYKTNRGGDITYHGPGQITVYPIFDLDQFYHDVHKYVRDLEEVVIRVLAEIGIIGIRIEGYTGVWLSADEKNPIRRKICAIGVHMSRWVTMHGFALNVSTDLNMFDGIIACGIQESDKSITSVQKELERKCDHEKIKNSIVKEFIEVFGLELI